MAFCERRKSFSLFNFLVSLFRIFISLINTDSTGFSREIGETLLVSYCRDYGTSVEGKLTIDLDDVLREGTNDFDDVLR